MKSRLEIAQEHRLIPIEAVAERLGLLPEGLMTTISRWTSVP